MIEYVLDELECRNLIAEMIDYAIETCFRDRPGLKIRKGKVHERIAEVTELKLSPDLRALINRRLALKGFKAGLRQGYAFFFDIEEVPRG